jgi:hypothetical protein
MEIFKDSTVQALKVCLKNADGIILVALNNNKTHITCYG